ncbi:MAG: DUF2085 domain-containing protein [Anaerolineae bacterium]|nr:DUF2085 domain-containing protein [Anaerolineae bacterium]
MYAPDQLPVELLGERVNDLLVLRAFIGNETLGWKVAWSDRMVYMYGSLWLASVIYGVLARQCIRIKPISLFVFVLLILPMAADGGTHLLSDLSGIARGFRYTNAWLAGLTGNVFSDSFYRGDAIGSFNSLMRLLTGILFGVACAVLGIPLIDQSMRINAHLLTVKLDSWAKRQQFFMS